MNQRIPTYKIRAHSVLAPRRAASAELDSASIRTPTIMEFFSIGTLLASLTEAHIAKGDLRHTDSRQQMPQAFVTSVRLLCEREVPLTHRLPAICLLEMHRKKGSLSLSLRFLLPMSEFGGGFN